MRVLIFSICKCCGIFSDEDPKESTDTVIKEESNYNTAKTAKGAREFNDTTNESPFRIKETRPRSVDYIIHSPRFGGIELPDGTGGTNSPHKKE